MIGTIFTPDCYKIITLFSVSPGSRFNRSEIKSKVYLNNVPLDKALQQLLGSGIMHRERNYYSLNFEHHYTSRLIDICSKQYKQLRELPLAVFYLLVDLNNDLAMFKGIELFLFGSYAKVIYKDSSDIDLALVHTEKVDIKKVNRLVSQAEKKYGKKVEIHFFEAQSFYKNKQDTLVKSILKDGVRLI